MKILITILLMAVYLTASAQDDEESWNRYLDQLGEIEDVEGTGWASAHEILSELAAHPIDINTATGSDINIEQRKPEEVTSMWYKEPMAPEGVKVYNPAFDVTDHELIAGIVTEDGILRPPYTESIKKLFEKK